MYPRPAPVTPSPQLTALLQEAAAQGLNLMDELLREAREALQRQIDQTRDLFERDVRARVVSALALAAPELRQRYPQVLRAAFERELGDNPTTTILDTGPSSIGFDQLELMDEQQVQERISAVRGLQQVLLESEGELAELNALVSGLLGFDQVRAERNPLRPEIYLDALQGLINELQGDALARSRWTQVMLPLLGKHLRAVYQQLLRRLRQQRVQPARYAIQRPAGGPAVRAYPPGYGPGEAPAPAGAGAAPGLALAPQGSGQPATASRLTVQQLHGLVSGAARDDGQLAQEVVNLLIANIAGDPRILPPVWQLIYQLEPALLALARADFNFFHDKQHPARQLLEEIAQHSFAYEREDALGFEAFIGQLQRALADIDPGQVTSPAPFAAALAGLRREWAQASAAQQAQQNAAVHALQQAERRNQLARQIADHIRAQPGTVFVPEVVVEFACGPWAQVMAQARIDGRVEQAGQPDYVALLEDLFWSVRADQGRQQPAQVAKLVPRLVRGLREGLESIRFPTGQIQAFLDQLFALHQGRRAERPAARTAPTQAGPWLAPEEARESGFMDDLGEPAVAPGASAADDFPATEPAPLPGEFPATEPMALEDLPRPATAPQPVAAAQPLALEQLQLGDWVELLVTDHWTRLQLAWLNEGATLCLFSSAGGANHSMTRRMFERLVRQGQLRPMAQAPVVDRAFNAVAAQALRNSVYVDIREHPAS